MVDGGTGLFEYKTRAWLEILIPVHDLKNLSFEHTRCVQYSAMFNIFPLAPMLRVGAGTLKRSSRFAMQAPPGRERPGSVLEAR
ncbi:MAG: hypothetical protein D6814_08460 [Calditrichaeota bacterium]|nr:MAG: hypothetical protein D6814_08460 [Calditrichota bacterium]